MIAIIVGILAFVIGAAAGFVGGVLVFNNNVEKIKKVIDSMEGLAPKK